MKILCLSDTHVGAGFEHRKDALADTDAMFTQVVDLAVDRSVDLVLHAGDPFHRAKPTPAELHCFKRFTDRLATEELPMIALGGNGMHDAAPGQRSALELFASRWMRVSRAPEVITELDVGLDPTGVTVCTLPAQPISRLVAASNGGSREQAYEQAVDLLLRIAADLYGSAPEDRPRVLLAHHMVSGASLPTGLPVDTLGGVILPLHELEVIGYDAIVLGDIHRGQKFNEGMDPVWYCGSPMCIDFGESEIEHGVWIWDSAVDEHFFGTAPLFVPLADRRFVTVDVDLTDAMALSPFTLHKGGYVSGPALDEAVALDETDAIAAAIATELPLTDVVLRVRYKATEDQHRRIDHAALHCLLDDAGIHKLYGGLEWVPVRESRARVEGFTEALAPMSAVDLWLAANTVDEPQAGALRTLLAGYLEGEA